MGFLGRCTIENERINKVMDKTTHQDVCTEIYEVVGEDLEYTTRRSLRGIVNQVVNEVVCGPVRDAIHEVVDTGAPPDWDHWGRWTEKAKPWKKLPWDVYFPPYWERQ